MRIGYFGRPIGLTGGIARYTQQLLSSLSCCFPENHYLIYTNRNSGLELIKNGIVRKGPQWAGRLCWEQLWLPAQLAKDRPNIYHSTDFTSPLICNTPIVITVHDLIFLRQPEGTSWRARILYNTLTRVCARKAKAIIAVSEYTKKDLSSYLGIDSSKIKVIPNGVDPEIVNVTRSNERESIIAAFGISRPFALFVGLLTPRKGVLTLLEAFDKAKDETGLKNLVLVGGPGAGFEKIERKIATMNNSKSVIMTGSADDSLLSALYGTAEMLCLPSYHEGFGLPIVEAMTFGCPVIASNVTSLPEVVGDAGLLAPPDDPGAWAQAMTSVVRDTNLKQNLTNKGLARSLEYTWDRVASATFTTYQEVAECLI